MHQISPAEFKAAVNLDPAWASKLTEPVEVVGYCDMRNSRITHLSPLLHFTATHMIGNAANFSNCPNLKVAEGTFDGWVCFAKSGIEKIGQLTITLPDRNEDAASFQNCPNLKVAEGTFPGFVYFNNSGIKRVGTLITQLNRTGHRADFSDCPQLILPKEFLGEDYQMDEEFRQKNLERITAGKAAAKAQKDTPTLEI